MFNCHEEAEDSLEHYAKCRIFHSLATQCVGISRPPANKELDEFLCLCPASHSLPPQLQGADSHRNAVALRALSIYALVRTHAARRHGVISAQDTSDAFRAFVREGARGSAACEGLLRQSRIRPRE